MKHLVLQWTFRMIASIKTKYRKFPGCPVVETQAANAGVQSMVRN